MVEKHRYARILYLLVFGGSLIWGITSVRSAYLAGELARDIVPIAIQCVCVLVIAAWTGYQAFKLWPAYFKEKRAKQQ
ncbi:MAG: hypothetical protein LBN34_07340 [Clostridiales Family XIII bacterium]|jgi:hypothetical protein|nr:hypothetical protein [Clostridiales Family XIII bacterium]